ncbi:PREDICTED: versican core protein-like [Branchiostoma belcheri]|uniref:Versican core protein-like n=1 Tax=Branchiostoma belcheri TaxID=7741 RepID=A0A6P5A101_BRABE|nr:PREDICTED: versican core protein-like [Branchiostoma belcheri]
MESDAKKAMMVLGAGLVRPAPSPPPPRNLETGEGEAAPGSGPQDESSDSPDQGPPHPGTPQATNRRGDGGAKTPRVGFKDRVREVWRKLKSDACRVLLGSVLLLVAAAVITVGVSLALEETSALKHNKDIRMWEWSKKIVTPWETAFYKNNSTIAHLTLPPSGTRLEWAEPTLSARANNEAVTTLITPVWTHGNNVTTATVVTPLLITDINECTSKPCQHGTCVNQDGGYKCTCSPGWTGQNCQQDINECTRNPCQHGRCVNKAGGYKCTCSAGWTGQNCQQAKQCKSGWSEFENHCYRLYPDKVTWSKANWQCKQHNANLASIKNRAENDFITDLIKNGFVRKLVWFGMTQGGRWQWTDGSRVIYTNWAPGKPDQTWLTYFGMEEKCGCLYSKTEKSWLLPSGGEKGQWNNMKCMANYSYICKAPK